MKILKVLLVGGGTGGHLYPLLSVSRKIRSYTKGQVKFLYIGPVNELSKTILEENGIKVKRIFSSKWRRYFSVLNYLEILLFPIGIIQSLLSVLLFMPDVVFSKGGYGSVGPVIAARLYFIPILIHESDAVAGRANRFLANLADKVAISFQYARQYFKKEKVFFTGNPVRFNITAGNEETARQIFNLRNNKPVIFVMGGSQGSEIINQTLVKALPKLLKFYQIIHLTGKGKMDEIVEQVGKLGIKISRSDYHPYEFFSKEMIHAYKIADLIISRAGATSITEIAANKKPSILIPLRHGANNHQIYNAYSVGRDGGAVVIEEHNLQREILIRKIREIFENRLLRENMTKLIGQFYYPDAADKLALALLYLGHVVDDIEGKGLFD
ncbi:MAG: undecaprenyldiphospho-muramoylpentapeptide beta-N-acetylglucosaminyltransferase [Candidatus Moranbacteria bacterium]|nr:undecaprenyldiphospho-muramoylpentapeptide beta-N-acetylglucosaminyltransferase [Candidatus Moranbacteria bacterium]